MPSFEMEECPRQSRMLLEVLVVELQMVNAYILPCLDVFFFFLGMVSLHSTGCPRTHRDPLASASQVLGLEAYATMPSCKLCFKELPE